MTSIITVMYPSVDDATFDMDYYLDKHMPMVGERFGSHGLKSWRILQAAEAPGGGKPAFSVVAVLEFGSAEQFAAAAKAEGETVFGDIPRFSNKQPTVFVGDVVAAG